jgi:hypothetical protein
MAVELPPTQDSSPCLLMTTVTSEMEIDERAVEIDERESGGIDERAVEIDKCGAAHIERGVSEAFNFFTTVRGRTDSNLQAQSYSKSIHACCTHFHI